MCDKFRQKGIKKLFNFLFDKYIIFILYNNEFRYSKIYFIIC